MADPLSMASGIAGLVSLADIVLTKTFRYVRAMRSADQVVQDLVQQMQRLYGTMNILDAKLKVLTDDLDHHIVETSAPDIVRDCTQLLDDIKQRLDRYQPKQQKKLQRIENVANKLRWPFEAAQTKELGERLRSFNAVLDTALLGDTLTAVHKVLTKAVTLHNDIKRLERVLSMNTHKLEALVLDKEQQEAFNFFNKADPLERHRSARKLCQSGTGRWFTGGDDFRNWMEGRKARLWLTGIPGAGKTILASSIIERIRQEASKSLETIALVYFYCDYKDPITHDPTFILRTIAAQLARWHIDALQILQENYFKHHRPGRIAGCEEDLNITEMILQMSTIYDKIFLVVDGLDECGKTMKEVAIDLNSLTLASNSNIQSIFLSRSEIDLASVLNSQYQEIRIAAQSQDLQLFVHAQLHRLDIDNPDDRDKISEVLINKAEGM